MPSAAAIYARISSDPTGDQLGVTRQIEDCQALADRRGWPVSDVYVDDDRSAYSGKPRPEYLRLLDDIGCGAVDAVIVWHLDRLHRQPRELEDFFTVCDRARVTDLASVFGDVDLATNDGRFMARILGAVSRKESDDKSRRITRKHQELALAGKSAGGGTRPYGYRPDRRTVEPSEAAVVREAVARVLAGDSLRGLAGDLNRRGVPTVKGRPWSVQVLRGILLGSRLSAQRSYRGEIVAAGDWEPIISPDETARLRAILTDPDRLTRRTVRRYLLSGGLLRCGVCGAVLTARPRSDGTRRYVCAKGPGLPGCGAIAIVADPLEALITEAVLYRLDTPELAAALAGAATDNSTAAAIHADLVKDQEQLEQVARAHGERQITFAELLAARNPIEARIEASRRKLSRLTRSTALDRYVGDSSSLRASWADLPLPRQRAVVAAVLDRAVIRPAVRGRNSFDPARVEPTWRL
jgi:site-specific DNA recombinase